VNGDYATPGNGASGYAVVRKGVVCNNKKLYSEGIYNNATGVLSYAVKSSCYGKKASEAVVDEVFRQFCVGK
jgi:hypothetical protein